MQNLIGPLSCSQCKCLLFERHTSVMGVPGNCREDCAHGVGQVPPHGMGVAVILQDPSTVLHETTPEEQVSEVDVQNVDDKVGNLAEEILQKRRIFLQRLEILL